MNLPILSSLFNVWSEVKNCVRKTIINSTFLNINKGPIFSNFSALMQLQCSHKLRELTNSSCNEVSVTEDRIEPRVS